MPNSDRTSAQTDEAIFTARYSTLRLLPFVIAMVLLDFLLFNVAYSMLSSGDFKGAILFGLASTMVLVVMLDEMFCAEIVFYRDRVTKVWHVFGSATIYYSRGQVTGPAPFLSRLDVCCIGRTKTPGEGFVLQMPVQFCRLFFPSNITKNVTAILDYLTNEPEATKWGRPIRRSELSKEFVCRLGT